MSDMIKVIKTDLFRLFRTKSFYAFPIFTAFVYVIQFIFKYIRIETENISINADAAAQAGNKIIFGVNDFFGCLNDGLVLVFLGVALMIFCTNETRKGFVKNAAGCVANRIYMPVSKIFVGVFILVVYVVEFTVIRSIAMLIESLISGRRISYEAIPAGELGTYAGFVAIAFFVNVTFIVLMVMIHELTYSKAIGITFIFLAGSLLLERIIVGAFALLRVQLGWFENINVGDYMLIMGISDGYKAAAYHPANLVVMCSIYTVIGVATALVAAKNRELR